MCESYRRPFWTPIARKARSYKKHKLIHSRHGNDVLPAIDVGDFTRNA